MSGSDEALPGASRRLPQPEPAPRQLAWLGSIVGQYAFSVALAVYAYRHGGATAVGS